MFDVRGVVFESAIERRDFGSGLDSEVLAAGIERSEVGGEGGVGASEAVEEADFVGGVGMVGEDVEVVRECCDPRDVGRTRSDWIGSTFIERCRCTATSALRNWFCLTSASTRRSLSSSRSLCASILKDSLSCSPFLISSSIMTPRSIETLYFDSRSSKEELVFLACRSMSSLATSISRSRS